MVRRLESFGGRVSCNSRVARIEVSRGRARAAVTDGGERYAPRRAILADVVAPVLYRQLVGLEHLPARMERDLGRFQLDNSTFKIDWLLDRRVPWQISGIADAGTVHIADSLHELSVTGLQLAERMIPEKPFVVVGQSTVADSSRTPDGRQLVWGYTHVPQSVRGDAGGDLSGSWSAGECEEMADRVEARIEAHAPGFRSAIKTRRILSPPGLAARDSNLIGGAINGGTSALHQQLIFRPTPGLGRPQTPVRGLFLASSSAHPGGGVHGACGANAARAALSAHRAKRALITGGATLMGTAAARRTRTVR
jgi:phytoene dehydrogenase-like protein